MGQIAIDVVLFPSSDMMDKAIELNRKIAHPNEPNFKLNKSNCVPHITLSMSCIEESNLDLVEDLVLKISKKYSKIKLSAENFRGQDLNDGKFIGLTLKDEPILKKMYEEIMISLQPHLTYESSSFMFFNPEEINDITIDWVNNWKNKHNNVDSYHPHLSLGIGQIIDYKFPIEFEVDKIAICQLGNYCTCRKVLFDVDLR